MGNERSVAQPEASGSERAQEFLDGPTLTLPSARRLAAQAWDLLSALIVRKGGLALVDQGVASAANFVATVIVARTLTESQFGFYTRGSALALLAMSLQTAIISTPYTVYSPRLRGPEQALYAGSTLLHQLAIAALCMVGLLAAALVIMTPLGRPDLAAIVWVTAAVAPLVLLRGFVRSLLFARLRMGQALLLDSCVAALQVGGLLTLAATGALSPQRAFWMMGLACGVPAAIWLLAERRSFAVRLPQAAADLRRNWSLGRWVLGTAIAREASSGIFPWLVAIFHGDGAAGAFGACCGVVMLANPFLMGMTNLLGPAAAHASARGGRAELDRVVSRGSLLLGLLMCGFLLVMLLWGGALVRLVYGNKYAGHGAAVAMLALSFFLRALILPVDAGLLATERPDVIMLSHVAGSVVTLVVGTSIVWLYGLTGAALADALKTAVTSTIRFRAFWSRGRNRAMSPK